MFQDPLLQARIIQEIRREEMAKASKMSSPDFQGKMTANEAIGRPPIVKRDALLSVLQSGSTQPMQPMAALVQNNVNRKMKRYPTSQDQGLQNTGIFGNMLTS